jgi:2-polyprenyl-6-methoxyphenol hydroxylase-like FAD-dependent oxidoreductase
VLVDLIGEAGVRVRLGQELDSFETVGDHVDVTFSDGSAGMYDLVVAADGIKSKTRGMSETPAPSGVDIWRVVTARNPDMTTSGLFYNGPQYKAGYTPISDELCYWCVSK